MPTPVYAPSPLDTSPTPGPYPLSNAVPDGVNTPIPIEGGPIVDGATTYPKVPVSMYVKDGNDLTQGMSTDANTANSVMGRLTKIRDLLAGTLSASITNATALGQALMSASSPVVIASDQGPLVCGTSTRTSVGAAISDTSLLASNAARKGALFFNESTAILYLAYGAAASLTSYTVQIPPNGFFEMPPQPYYTGAIRGIWSAVNGNCRITELS